MAFEHLRKLDLNLIITLNTLIQEKHISRSADKLGLTQSAVSHALNRLRAYFNDPLLIKDGRVMMPSPFAKRIHPEIKNILHQISNLSMEEPEFNPATCDQTFTIGLPEYMAITLLSDLNKTLSRLAPKIKIITINVSAKTGIQNLENGEADLIIGRFENAPKIFQKDILFKEDYVCILRKKHPLLKNGKISKKNYLSSPHMHISLTGRNTGYLDEHLKKHKMERNVQMTLSNYMLGLLMVETNDLIVSEPRHTVMPLSKKLNVNVAELPFQSPQFEVSQLWHHRSDTNLAHQWIREQIKTLSDKIA